MSFVCFSGLRRRLLRRLFVRDRENTLDSVRKEKKKDERKKKKKRRMRGGGLNVGNYIAKVCEQFSDFEHGFSLSLSLYPVLCLSRNDNNDIIACDRVLRVFGLSARFT